jgi:DNA invertase Pin-like site-specific DNA recombinase
MWKLDRLGRNLRHLVNVVPELTERDIGLRVLCYDLRAHSMIVIAEESPAHGGARSYLAD